MRSKKFAILQRKNFDIDKLIAPFQDWIFRIAAVECTAASTNIGTGAAYDNVAVGVIAKFHTVSGAEKVVIFLHLELRISREEGCNYVKEAARDEEHVRNQDEGEQVVESLPENWGAVNGRADIVLKCRVLDMRHVDEIERYGTADPAHEQRI